MAEGYYGYSPEKYIQDFSWVGEIGRAVSATALKMPELIELNKQIKENNKFKEITYDAAIKYIDQLDIKHVSNILSSWGMAEDVKVGPENAKNKLKARILKYQDSSSNEEYAKKIANSFFVPFLQAAQSEAGGGVLKFGDIFGNLKSGVLQEAIRSSSVGQDVITREKEQQTYETGKTREEEKYQLDFERKHGFKPTPDTGEIETTFEQQQKLEADAEKEKFELEKTRKQEKGNLISNVVTQAESSMDVWNEDKFQEVPSDVRTEAFKIWKEREGDELKARLKATDQKLKELNIGSNKPVPATVIESTMNTIQSMLAKENTNLANLNNKDKNYSKQMRKMLISDNKWRIKQLEDRLKKLQKVQLTFSEGGEYTQGGLNKAYTSAEYEVQSENVIQEKQLVDAFNSGKYSGSTIDPRTWGKEDDKKKFIKDYISISGKEPIFDNQGKAIPQLQSPSKPIDKKTETTFEQRKEQIMSALGPQYDKIIQQNPQYSEEQIIEELYQKMIQGK